MSDTENKYIDSTGVKTQLSAEETYNALKRSCDKLLASYQMESERVKTEKLLAQHELITARKEIEFLKGVLCDIENEFSARGAKLTSAYARIRQLEETLYGEAKNGKKI